ncbi:hypothetical protein N7532_008835 [Penicillium argentinense]|uniref:histidine kinase n=1 Tax=Penicillium argentinense TaxID=1131581 RepID=A0A9W9K2F4_9EURO|nr:uncharacterized protein N7532_008835 [Penicillium argentinense]KAJ5090151.1 hypothetical protein N7532_008835 [Penicillium argentinense]
MTSSPKLSTHDDCRAVNNDQDEQDDRATDSRQTLARTLSIPQSMCILSDTKPEIPTVTELDPPKLKLPQLGSDSIEKVFPVRSVLSFDSTPSSAIQTPPLDKLESPLSPFSDAVRVNGLFDEKSRTRPSQPPTAEPNEPTRASRRPNYLSRLREQKHELSGYPSPLSTLPIRKHRPSENTSFSSNEINHHSSGDSHDKSIQLHDFVHECGGILTTSKAPEGLLYSQDDDSNISIQGFGALIVLFGLEGNYIVQAASSNSKEVIGISPDELFELASICDILPKVQQQDFISHAEMVLDDGHDVELSGPEVICLSMKNSDGHANRFWCTMHTSKAYKDYLICELEPETEDLEPGILNMLPPIFQQISSAQTMDELGWNAISSLQSLARFDRVTMYHFDGNRNGTVVADSVDPALGIDSLGGMNFTEFTFNEQLKTEYLRNTVSLAYSKKAPLADLTYRFSISKLGLDLSHCYLQASPASTQQISSSQITACMSIGIYVFGKLWGLVSCQSYDQSFKLHPLLQRVSWLISETLSSNIERLSYSLPFQNQEYIYPEADNSSQGSPNEFSADILSLFGADYAAASILGETKILGKPQDSSEVLALLEYLRAKNIDTVLWSTDILSDFDDLDYAPGFRHLVGLLYIPLSTDGHDFMTFFKSEMGCLPIDLAQSNEWSASELGKASMLSLMYRTFTDIWQEKEAAMQNNQLLRLLLANSAHEFRTPLNAIINYLEIALDGNLNQETRENISRSHSASKSLVYIINDLLDLTNAENGQRLIKDEVFSLSETLCEATNIFWEEARQKQVDLQVVQHSALPPVLGDQRRVRQVITNLISNALQHTSVGAVTIESCILSESCEPGHIAIEVAIHDTGSGMPQETMETLFCELEQVSNKGYMQHLKSCRKTSDTASLETDSVLGLGLALVARIVSNMNGQLSLKSEEGSGSCFKIRLRFPLPSNQDGAPAMPDGQTRQEKEPSFCEKDKSEQKQEETAKSKDPLAYRCGDGASNIEELGRQDGSFVDVDVSLEGGESRSIALSTSDQITLESTSGPDPESKADRNTELNILVAEDDPINSTIVRKRLEKFGYSIRMTSNGKECAGVFRENLGSFNAVLMDLQMPIVDGSSATKMIREHEAELSTQQNRIPIFAVSASLVERDRQSYIDSGFDGWIMKPIDFHRVHVLLGGVSCSDVRNGCLYQPGMWEQGGWFEPSEVSGDR